MSGTTPTPPTDDPTSIPPAPNVTVLLDPPGTGTTTDLVLWVGILMMASLLAFGIVTILCKRVIKYTSEAERERRRLKYTRNRDALESKFDELKKEFEEEQAATTGVHPPTGTLAAMDDAHGGEDDRPDDRGGQHDGHKPIPSSAIAANDKAAMMKAADALAWNGDAPTNIGGDDSDNDSDIACAALSDLPVVNEHVSMFLEPAPNDHTVHHPHLSKAPRLKHSSGSSLMVAAGKHGAKNTVATGEIFAKEAQRNTNGELGTWGKNSPAYRLAKADTNPFVSKREIFTETAVPDRDHFASGVYPSGIVGVGVGANDDAIFDDPALIADPHQSSYALLLSHQQQEETSGMLSPRGPPQGRRRRGRFAGFDAVPSAKKLLVGPVGDDVDGNAERKNPLPLSSLPWASTLQQQRGVNVAPPTSTSRVNESWLEGIPAGATGSVSPTQPFPPPSATNIGSRIGSMSPERRLRAAADRSLNTTAPMSTMVRRRQIGLPHNGLEERLLVEGSDDDQTTVLLREPKIANARKVVDQFKREQEEIPLPDFF